MTTTLHCHTLHGQKTFSTDSASDPRGLADLLAQRGLALNTRCNQRGLCKGCSVFLEKGKLQDSRDGKNLEAPAELLSCLAEWIPGTDADITIPSRSLLAHKPSVADDFQIKVPTGEDPLFPGSHGLAIDIGTTTVVVMLAELDTGKILARASDFNQQIRMGDDVLARIQACIDPDMVSKLQSAICQETILPLARKACAEAKIPISRVGGLSVAANTTMLHLLFGINPTPLGFAPFTPVFLEHRVQSAASIGLSDFADKPVHALPGLGAYVGADIAAGIFAVGLQYESDPVLFVDVGTNGEIVLSHEENLACCATAAGPAFEGSGLSCGMRATDGAIEGIQLTADKDGVIKVELKTIKDLPLAQAPGICGSAYVDFFAQGRASGVLMENGRFDSAVVAANPSLFQRSEYGLSMLLRNGSQPIIVSEPDIALLLQAKAAIAAGIQTLLHRLKLETSDVQKVYLAGGFGMHLDIPHTIACGLLPGFTAEQVETVGNTSLGGAYLAMLDRTVLDELDRIRNRVEVIELNLDPGFEDRYIDQLSL